MIIGWEIGEAPRARQEGTHEEGSVPRGPTWHWGLRTFHGVIHQLLTRGRDAPIRVCLNGVVALTVDG